MTCSGTGSTPGDAMKAAFEGARAPDVGAAVENSVPRSRSHARDPAVARTERYVAGAVARDIAGWQPPWPPTN